MFPLISARNAYLIPKLLETAFKKVSAYLKVKRVIHITSHDSVIVSFQITLNNYHYDQ